MSLAEAYELVSEWGKHLPGVFPISEQRKIESLYLEVFRRPLRSCRCKDRYSDTVIEMRIYLKKNMKMRKICNYRLKAGVVIQPGGTSDVYTNDNLTDAVATAFLKERPGAVGLFEVIPEKKSDPDIEINPDLRSEIAADLQAGKSKTAIKKDYKGRQIAGKTITLAVINAHIKAAEAEHESNDL